ncbi:MAG TPA: hypothetical protein VMM36_00535, partial [Opitutaceae bacterium]|nr:hypothetical protein [Opitutaceae bacterium]
MHEITESNQHLAPRHAHLGMLVRQIEDVLIDPFDSHQIAADLSPEFVLGIDRLAARVLNDESEKRDLPVWRIINQV